MADPTATRPTERPRRCARALWLVGLIAWSAAAQDGGAGVPDMERRVAERINTLREDAGRAALERRAELDSIARDYSRAMYRKDFFAHTGPQGRDVSDRVRAAGLCYRVVGENIAHNRNLADPADAAVQGWMESPGHRRNILNPDFAQTGVGVWRAGDAYYFTQVFFTPGGPCP